MLSVAQVDECNLFAMKEKVEERGRDGSYCMTCEVDRLNARCYVDVLQQLFGIRSSALVTRRSELWKVAVLDRSGTK